MNGEAFFYIFDNGELKPLKHCLVKTSVCFFTHTLNARIFSVRRDIVRYVDHLFEKCHIFSARGVIPHRRNYILIFYAEIFFYVYGAR